MNNILKSLYQYKKNNFFLFFLLISALQKLKMQMKIYYLQQYIMSTTLIDSKIFQSRMFKNYNKLDPLSIEKPEGISLNNTQHLKNIEKKFYTQKQIQHIIQQRQVLFQKNCQLVNEIKSMRNTKVKQQFQRNTETLYEGFYQKKQNQSRQSNWFRSLERIKEQRKTIIGYNPKQSNYVEIINNNKEKKSPFQPSNLLLSRSLDRIPKNNPYQNVNLQLDDCLVNQNQTTQPFFKKMNKNVTQTLNSNIFYKILTNELTLPQKRVQSKPQDVYCKVLSPSRIQCLQKKLKRIKRQNSHLRKQINI